MGGAVIFPSWLGGLAGKLISQAAPREAAGIAINIDKFHCHPLVQRPHRTLLSKIVVNCGLVRL